MTLFKGRSIAVGLSDQTNYDTSATTAKYTVPFMSVSVDDQLETLQNESAVGNIAHYNDSITTGVHGEGDIETKLWHNGLYYFLLWAFGQAPTKTTNADGSYTYTFSMLNNNQHKAFTVFMNDPNNPVKFPCALLNEMTISWTPDAFATLTASLISKRSVAVTGGFAPAYAEDAEFRPDQLELKIADTVDDLEDADVATKFTSAELTITKNVEGMQTSDSGQDFGAFSNGDLEASISFEKLYDDTTYRDIALNDTQKALSFGFIDNLNKAGTTNPTSLKFILPKVKLSSYTRSFGLSDTATEAFDGMGLFDITEGALITAELTTKYNYTA